MVYPAWQTNDSLSSINVRSCDTTY